MLDVKFFRVCTGKAAVVISLNSSENFGRARKRVDEEGYCVGVCLMASRVEEEEEAGQLHTSQSTRNRAGV